MSKKALFLSVGVVVVGVVSFYGGLQYQSSIRTFTRGNVGAAGGARSAQGRPVNGEVISMDKDSLTVKLLDGSTKIVNISHDTTYTKTASASASEVLVGVKLGVFGQTNSDGSVSAQSVQINPQLRGIGAR
ncbi:MAG: hypothetical protein WCJ70_01575 [bacterium]